MESYNRKLVFGYIVSNEYLKELHGDRFYGYAYSQAIQNLALPYGFHISGVLSILISLFSNSCFTNKPHTLLFGVLIITFLITLILYTRYFEKKYPVNSFETEVKNASEEQKKTALKASTLFFILNMLVFILVELPLVVLI